MQSTYEWLEPYNELHQTDWDSYSHLQESFDWEIPEVFNAAHYLCDRWGDDDERIAVLYEDHTSGREGELTYLELKQITNQLANYLEDQGVKPGDRIAINTPQKIETLISHLAIWKIGAISVPLSVLYGPEALDYRLSDSSASVCIVDESNIDNHRDIVRENQTIEQTLVVGDADLNSTESNFWSAIDGYSDEYELVKTDVMDTMTILYSSGTTGPPKGIVQPHRCVIGHLPSVITSYYDCTINSDDVIWTPSEWAWGASISAMFAALFFGQSIVAYENGKGFDANEAFSVIEQYDVTISYFVPSALRMMMQIESPREQYDISSVRVIPSGGESLGASVRTWADSIFDARIYELYGLSETFNFIIGDVPLIEPTPGWMGFSLPGHEIALLDPDTHEVLEGEAEGEIALADDDPTLFTEYLNKPEKTDSAFSNGWFLTGDIGRRNAEGRYQFLGRKDDLIISAGYRIGPEEIEDTLLKYDVVADAGVIGVPDEERGEIPKAFIVLEECADPGTSLKSDIKSYVKETLAAYEYPREIEFIDKLPRTTSDKVRRRTLSEWEEDNDRS